MDIFRIGIAGMGTLRRGESRSYIFAADMVCVQDNEVGNHSVFSINSNHKAIEA